MCLQESSFGKTSSINDYKCPKNEIDREKRVICLAAKLKASPVWAQHEQTLAIEEA